MSRLRTRKFACDLVVMAATTAWLATLAYLWERRHGSSVFFETIEDEDDSGIDQVPGVNCWAREYRGGRRWA